MSFKVNSIHVIRFSFLPIGGVPKSGDRRESEGFIWNSAFDPNALLFLARYQVDHYLKPGDLPQIIDATEVYKIGKTIVLTSKSFYHLQTMYRLYSKIKISLDISGLLDELR